MTLIGPEGTALGRVDLDQARRLLSTRLEHALAELGGDDGAEAIRDGLVRLRRAGPARRPSLDRAPIAPQSRPGLERLLDRLHDEVLHRRRLIPHGGVDEAGQFQRDLDAVLVERVEPTLEFQSTT